MCEDLIEKLRKLIDDRCGDGPSGRNYDPELLDVLTEAAAALKAARGDACVALVADIRFACGDNGKRMQPELVEFIRGLENDARHLDWLASEARQIGVWPCGGRWEIPAIQIVSARDRCTPEDLRAAIYDEYQSAITGGET